MEPAQSPLSVPITPVSPAPVTQTHRTSLWWYILVAIVLVVCGAGAYFWSTQRTMSAAKVYHVGVLNALDYFAPTIDGFKQEMTALGYVEGKNIFYDVQKGPAPVGNQDIITKFVADSVDLILVFPTETSLEAKEITRGTIPIISTEAAMEGNDLVESIQHPGGNLTGVRFPVPELALKKLEILHQLVPKAKRIWLPYLKDYPTVAPGIEAIRPTIAALQLTLIEAPFSTPDELAAYLAAHATTTGMDAILTIPEPISILPPFIAQIYAFADAHSIPVAGAEILDTDSGPIFSLIPSSFEVGRLAAPLADKIFKGTSAGTIPIVTPESRFEINYKAVQKLKLEVSESLLSVADRVVH